MGKINWSRVFLGGLLAGVVLIILGFATFALYLKRVYDPALEALGHPFPALTVGDYVIGIVFSLVVGILAVWLYSAIRPRYGAGPKTAVCAGLAFWALISLFPSISLGSLGLFPGSVLLVDSLTSLVMYVVATLLGAWVYKEQSQ
jgi:magnesium-transporting ATPase (P-type)